MVRNKLTFLLLMIILETLSMKSSASTRFVLEASKNTFYEGEPVLLNFVLYSDSNLLDIEVVKFPEFRGYWSENLLLRQGPVQLLPFQKTNRLIMGTYVVSSMLGKKDASILPMKLFIKENNQSKEYSSENPSFTIKNIPKGTEHFIGGIGRFSIRYDQNEILFRENEPSLLRIYLQGEGNFPEINELPIQLVDQIEITSKRTYTQGSSQFSLKTFEYQLLIHRKDEFYLPKQELTFFNPDSQKYESLQLPEMKISPAPPLPPEPKMELELPIETGWNPWIDLSESWPFHLIQFFLAVFFFSIFSYRRISEFLSQHRKKPKYQLYRLYVLAETARKNGNKDSFFQIIYFLILDILNLIPQNKEKQQLIQLHQELDKIRYGRDKTNSINENSLSQQIKKNLLQLK